MPAPTDPPFPDDAAGAPSGLSRRRLLTGAALTAAAGLAARPAVASAAPRVAAGPGAALRAAGDAGGGPHQVTFDPYSLMIDGKRLSSTRGAGPPGRGRATRSSARSTARPTSGSSTSPTWPTGSSSRTCT